MIKNVSAELGRISEISKRIVNSIESSKDQIHDIVENIRNEVEQHRKTLKEIKTQLNKTISEVDAYEMQNRTAKQRLYEVSGNMNRYTELDIKDAYEKAFDIMIKLNTLRNTEKNLREKRDQIELSLMKALKNIENAEKVMTQINVVLSYLKGDILATIEGMDKNSEFMIGMKILEAQEDERKRISREIHDGPAQSIANIVMQADICEQMLKKDIDSGMQELQALKDSVRNALLDIRNIIFDLRPMILDDLGLTKTIETICNKFTETTHLSIEKKLKNEPKNIDPIIQVATMRIIQEILNNIKKHAKAKKVTVALDFGTKYVFVMVSDDGVGFDVESVMARIKDKSESYGLIGLMDRVKQLQGTITLNSKVGLGTAFSVKLPINKEVMENDN